MELSEEPQVSKELDVIEEKEENRLELPKKEVSAKTGGPNLTIIKVRKSKLTKADSVATPQLLGFGSSPGVPTKGLKRRNSGGKLNATQDNWLKEYSQFNMNAI